MYQSWEDECVSKEIFSVGFSVAGRAAADAEGGRATLEEKKQHWDFDSTMGFPGEDINCLFVPSAC